MFRARTPMIGLLAVVVTVAGSLASAPVAVAVDLSSPVVISEVYGRRRQQWSPVHQRFHRALQLEFGPGDPGRFLGPVLIGGGHQLAGHAPGRLDPRLGLLPDPEGSGAGAGVPLPTPNASGIIALSAPSGQGGLRPLDHGTEWLCGRVLECGRVVDFWDSERRTTRPVRLRQRSPTPPRPNAGSARLPTRVTTAPTSPWLPPPRPGSRSHHSAASDMCGDATAAACTAGPITIQDVQGDGFISPLKGQDGRSGGRRGDGSAAHREQPRVLDPGDPAGPGADVGLVRCLRLHLDLDGRRGRLGAGQRQGVRLLSLSSGETLATTSSLSVTEIAPTVVTVVSSGNRCRPPLVLGPTTVPDTFSPTVSGGTSRRSTR